MYFYPSSNSFSLAESRGAKKSIIIRNYSLDIYFVNLL